MGSEVSSLVFLNPFHQPWPQGRRRGTRFLSPSHHLLLWSIDRSWGSRRGEWIVPSISQPPASQQAPLFDEILTATPVW